MYMQITDEHKSYDVIVMGGGASGMMAAVVASSRGEQVLIIEHNKDLGKKLKITGGGRCNILNAELDQKVLLSHYDNNIKNSKNKASNKLIDAFNIFGVEQSIKFFDNLGIKIKTEDRKRAFPISEKAYDVYQALHKELIKNKVSVLLKHKVKKIILNKEHISGVEIYNTESRIVNTISAKRYILATGGASHPETGSTGDGFKILKDLGFKIVEPTPSLVPIKSNSQWVQLLQGRTLKNLKINIFVDGKQKLVLNNKSKDTDKNVNILCTHFGLSGPSMINNSKAIGDLLKEGDVTASMDLFKSMDVGELDKYILNIFDKNKNKKLKNILNDICPDNVLEIILNNYKEENSFTLNINANNSHFDLEKEINNVSREERKLLINLLKDLRFSIDGLMGNDKAIIVDGGIDLDDIDLMTMRTKKIHNLQITGDLLDIARPSGGYSLQLCWTTGYIAGSQSAL